MVKLTNTLSRLNKCKILVIGDLMLDTYTIGKARRISPEAPVAVVQVLREENRAGGAGNVALNLISLNADVSIVGRVGFDAAGESLRNVLQAEKICVEGLFVQPSYHTPIKNRIIADNQQVVRIDHEQITPLPEMLEQQVIKALPALFEGVSAVAISDYGKGFLTTTLLAAIIAGARARSIPVITDPKGVDFAKYSGTTIIKPNLSEAYSAAGLLSDAPLEMAAKKILELCNADILMVTRSEEGISIFRREGVRLDFPVRAKEIKDVTGAGDTVLAMLACAIANGLGIAEAAELSNVAAGIAIERFGCARISVGDLAQRLLESDVSNKVFDNEHLYALKKILEGNPFTLLGMSSREGMTSGIFKAIQNLSKNSQSKLVVHISDEECDADFIHLLSSIHDVKFIITNNDNLNRLCQEITPSDVYEVKGNELAALGIV